MGTPVYPRDMATEFNKVRRDVKNAFTSANQRTGMAKIGAAIIEITGELIMQAGAKLTAKYANDVNAFFVGRHTTDEGDEVEGLIVRRPNGNIVLHNWGNDILDGAFAIYDNRGNMIFGDDAVSKQGLSKPWLPYTSIRYSEVTNPLDVTTSATFVDHHLVMGFMQHPKISVYGYVSCNGDDVAEIQLIQPDSAAVVANSGSVTSGWVLLEGIHDTYTFGSEFQYNLQVRKVSGTGTGVGFTPVRIYGRES